nr:hypothetical protein [Tanacetum cinerariifolium]
LKKYSKKDKSEQNGKRGEAGKRLKQLQWIEQEKPKKNAKRMVENAYTVKKLFKFKEEKRRQRLKVQIDQSSSRGAQTVKV